MSAGLKFFYDAFSQPCRAVQILLEAGNIPYQPCLVNIARGEPRSMIYTSELLINMLGETKSNEDFIKASPSKTVPAIDDNGFRLFER